VLSIPTFVAERHKRMLTGMYVQAPARGAASLPRWSRPSSS